MGSLILARHATTEASAAGRNLGQASDPPLAAEGRDLAAELASAIAAELAELPHDELRLVSSPARRCLETIRPVADALGIAHHAIEKERGLLEIAYGAWEGLTEEESEAHDSARRVAWEADPYATRCPEGESGADVEARSAPVFDAIERWLAADRRRCAVVVAHNHVNRLRICRAMGWPMADYRRRQVQVPGGYSIVTFGGELPVVRRVNAAPA